MQPFSHAVLELNESVMSSMNAGDPTSGMERLFWEKAPIPALQCLPDGKCLDANESAVAFFDKELESLKQTSLISLAAKDSQAILNQFLEKCVSGKDCCGPVIIKFDCGDRSVRTCWVNARIVVTSDYGDPVLLIQVQETKVPDIPQTQSPDSMLHYASDAIFVIDMNHRVQFWNAGAKRIFDWDEEETLGVEMAQLAFFNTPEITPLLDSLQDIEHWSGEIGATSKSGEHKNIEARFNLLKDSDGRLEGILAIVTDITEKRTMEECYIRAQRL